MQGTFRVCRVRPALFLLGLRIDKIYLLKDDETRNPREARRGILADKRAITDWTDLSERANSTM